MKLLLEYLEDVFESFSVTFDEKEDALSEIKKNIGDLSEAIEKAVTWLYDNSVTKYPLIFNNKKEGSFKCKVQRNNWVAFKNFVLSDLSDHAREGKNSVVIDKLTIESGNGTPGGKYTDDGDTAGQYAESLCCYFFNKYGTIENINDEEIQEKIDEIERNSGVVINDTWRNAIKYILDSIALGSTDGIAWNNKNYIAIHVDGKDIDLNVDWVKPISKIYSGGQFASKVLGGHSFKSIPSGNKKDMWNKADIVLVKKDESDVINTIKNSLIEIGSEKSDKSDELNNILNTMVVKGVFVPLSLKMLTNIGVIKQENIPSAQQVDIIVEKYKLVLPKYINKPGYSGSLWLVCETNENLKYGIQFRSQTDNSQSLSIEASLPNNSNARGGKGVTLVKNEIGITSNKDKSYLAKFDSDDDMCEQLFKCGFDIETIDGKKVNLNQLKKVVADYKAKGTPVYQRTCFAGFVGIFNKFCDKCRKDDMNDQQNFATNVLNKCTLGSGTSSFYLIS